MSENDETNNKHYPGLNESHDTPDEVSPRVDLQQQIRELTAQVRRLQNDNLELASIREYLKSLRELHSRCGQVVKGVIDHVKGDSKELQDLRKTAEDIVKLLASHAQR